MPAPEEFDDQEDSQPLDIDTITTVDYATGRIDTNLFAGQIDGHRDDGVEFGIEVHLAGPDIAISAGTTWSPEDQPELYTYHALTTDQARKIADALNDVADRAEEMKAQTSSTPESRKSLLGRLMSR